MAQVIPFHDLSDLARKIVPPRFHRASFETFECRTPSQRAAMQAVRSWLENLAAGPMLALVGDTGTGKSHLLYSAVHQLCEQKERERGKAVPGWSLFVRSWYGFVDSLRYGSSGDTPSGPRNWDPHQVRTDWWSADVALIDEVRPTSGTAFDDTELARYACHAYDQQRAVLITTNVHPLSDVLGPAAASRFTEVIVRGPDGRKVTATSSRTSTTGST